MIPRTVGKADDVDVRFDQAGDDRPAAQVDDAEVGRPGDVPADGRKAPVADHDRVGDGAARVHRVDSAVDERER
ncbi:hypothetical protein D3C83_65340 [compost metagenome]